MTAVCIITSLSFLANPENYANFLHTIGAIEIPVHSFVAFIILFRTPRQMSSVKYPLFYLHFWTSLLDIHISLLMSPLLLYPELASISLGLWEKIGLSAKVETSLMIIFFAMVGTSLCGIYENRYSVLASPLGVWKYNRYALQFVNHVLSLAFVYPIISAVPEQKIAQELVWQRLPCPPPEPYQNKTFILALDWRSSATYAVPFAVFIILQIAIFLSMSICILRRALEEQKFSSSTLRMQRKFLFSVIIQTAIPFCVLLAPMVFNCYTIGWHVQMQGLTNVGFIFMTLHGLSSSLAILMIHRPYRDATFLIFQRNINIHTSVVSSTR